MNPKENGIGCRNFGSSLGAPRGGVLIDRKPLPLVDGSHVPCGLSSSLFLVSLVFF